jgi:hypothetical protein
MGHFPFNLIRQAEPNTGFGELLYRCDRIGRCSLDVVVQDRCAPVVLRHCESSDLGVCWCADYRADRSPPRGPGQPDLSSL